MKYSSALVDLKYRHLLKVPVYSLLVASLLVLSACGPSSSGNSNKDSDGDGLTDAEEAKFGTSPKVKDSDGDGFSDFQETVEFGFNPDNNNLRFNRLLK